MSSGGEGDAAAGGIVSLLRRLLADTRVRFLLVGGTNTVLGYAMFAALYFLALHEVPFGYLISLLVSYAISIPIAFLLYRRFVFVVTGAVVRDFIAFVGVNASSVALNALLLWLLVELAGAPPLLAQALALIVTTVLSYVGHRFVSFRRPPAPGSLPPV